MCSHRGWENRVHHNFRSIHVINMRQHGRVGISGVHGTHYGPWWRQNLLNVTLINFYSKAPLVSTKVLWLTVSQIESDESRRRCLLSMRNRESSQTILTWANKMNTTSTSAAKMCYTSWEDSITTKDTTTVSFGQHWHTFTTLNLTCSFFDQKRK